ncbi:hypothetical protein [Pedobacter hiemivivus]|uniref:Uncharacterized protein n=1 Tax=Pedobacter hiemivivus TaxID=2530454 RepID=A0A4R0NBL8_9SPHI|nr:hypothetical protein [Pedobacter hiemivivus]TCC97711.1 hypothetical protein EZ444_07285 [Pedobacter hiemivivus]
MKQNSKTLLFILGIVIVFILIMIIVEKGNDKIKAENNASIDENLSRIQLKGKVIHFSIIDRYGKQYYMICIKLDYSNVSDFYLFKQSRGLKIKDGIATMSGGIFMKDKIINYVEINMNNSGKEKFLYKNGDAEEFDLSYGAGGIEEGDMNVCN